jgi:Xaa-Pro aminopeptidase
MKGMRLFEYDRLSRLMRQHGADVLLAHTKPNLEYITDFEWMRGFDKNNFLNEVGSAFVVSFAGLPADESKGPFYIAASTETGYPEAYNCWIKDVRYWGPTFHVEGRRRQMDVADNPMSRVAEALKEKGLDRGRVALERRQIEMVYYEQLRDMLPHARIVDAEPILNDLRMIKSDEEVRRLRKVANTTSEVMDSVYRSGAYEGMTEWDLERYLDVGFAQRGARHVWTDVAFGPKGANFVGPTDTRLERGHILRLDIGGWSEGYVTDMSRSLAWGGKPTDAARRAHAAIYRMNQEITKAVRPGVVPSDLYRMLMRIFEEEGYQSLTPQAGHSLGRTAHEPPFLVAGYDRPLETGMIVVVEPTMRIQGAGSFNIEDTTLVTEEGCEVLTTTPREIEAYL